MGSDSQARCRFAPTPARSDKRARPEPRSGYGGCPKASSFFACPIGADFAELHRPAGFGRPARIALAEDQDVLMGFSQLPRCFELAPDADRQRSYRRNQDRIVVVAGAGVFEGFDRSARQIDEETVFIANVANDPYRETIIPQPRDGGRYDF